MVVMMISFQSRTLVLALRRDEMLSQGLWSPEGRAWLNSQDPEFPQEIRETRESHIQTKGFTSTSPVPGR